MKYEATTSIIIIIIISGGSSHIAMLLVESPIARSLRQIMLDIVIDYINQKSGGKTKYIKVCCKKL